MKAQAKVQRTRIGRFALLSLIAAHKGRVALLSVATFAGALFEAFFIVALTSIGMALVSGAREVGPLLGYSLSVRVSLLSAALALAARLILSLAGVRVSASLVADVTTEQRQDLAHAYLRASWAVQHAEPAGRLQELLTSFVARVTQSMTTLTNALTAGLSLLAFLGTGFAVDPLATSAVLLALGGVGAILTPLRRAIRTRSSLNAQANLRFANAISELGSLGQEMQAFGAQTAFEERIDHLTHHATTTQRHTQVLQNSMQYIYLSLAYAAVLAGIALLSWLAPGNVGTIGAVMLLMVRSLSYGQQLATASAGLAANAPFLTGVRETVRRYAQSQAARGTNRPSKAVPVVMRDVSFSYEDRNVLSSVTFQLDAGEAIGVIGPSGAGKSTLAQLLLGLREPTAGCVQVSGTPLTDVDRHWWSLKVAFVPQDAKLFTGTVADNIRFFRDISDDSVAKAATQANILADIESLPDGFNTHLGERGSQLSGGQRQRLSIARALAGEPQLLILDEPTSALDGKSEALIRQTLQELHGSISVFIIAHRMSTLEACDRIMVIENGIMTALATPTSLKANNAFYREALSIAGVL